MSNNAAAGFRLSSQQERLWSQQSSRAPSFWTECELLVEGPLDPGKLRDVLRGVVARHEILRTVFHRQTGLKLPFQVILDAPDFAWQAADLSGQGASAQREAIQKLVNSRNVGFDTERRPVLQVILATLARDKFAFVLGLPALCGDLRTMQNLTDEIGRVYASGFNECDEVMQYADIAEWQQELLASDETKTGRDFWRNYCRKIDFTSLDSVLSASERKTSGDFAPDVVVKSLEVTRLALQPSESWPEFLLACWQVFLSRMTGRPNITVGCQFDGRTYAELAAALGALSKSLPRESVCSDATTFQSLLDRVKHDSADFRSWQDSFSWGTIGLDAGLEQGPVLPLAFDFAKLPDRYAFGALKVTTSRLQAVDEQFRLKLSVRHQDQQVWLEFHFDAGRLDRSTVECWSEHFLTLLSAAAAKPETLTSRLPLLGEEARRRLLTEWNQTTADYPHDRCIHELFEAQAATTPDLPALRYEGECLSYRDLNEQANRLAHYLRSKGVGCDSLVGLCVDRGAGMMVALLAILKAGGAYVPVSADHPKPRLQQQLAGASTLLTEAKFECLMPSFDGLMFLLDRDREQWLQQPKTNPQPVTSPEHLAYVIYTSGSTGVPKGVGVCHRNLVNYTSFIQRRLQLDKYLEPLHFATVSTLSADLGNTCIYPSLVSGGCLHVIAHDVASDGQRLGEYFAKYPVDVLKIVPSHLMALLNAGGGREVLPRKHLVMGGEALTIPLMEKIVAAGGACEVLNHYGPTETTVGSLTLQLKAYDWKNSSAQTIPIGRPIANTRVYILDAHGEPVPAGVAGELYIAGDGVTAGYINQPELTGERFIPARFGPNVAGKMYRTGDLVRYLPDGNIEFLGRVDDQVKIRGFRIALGSM